MNLLLTMKEYPWMKKTTNGVHFVCVMDVYKINKDDTVKWGLPKKDRYMTPKEIQFCLYQQQIKKIHGTLRDRQRKQLP